MAVELLLVACVPCKWCAGSHRKLQKHDRAATWAAPDVTDTGTASDGHLASHVR